MTDSTLNRFIASGTNAERLAFTPSPPTPGSGPDQSYIWHETDTGDTFMWDFDASAWDQVNGATGLANDLTFDTSGGATAPTVFDGSAAKTIDYSTVGAASSGHTHTLDGLSDVDTTGVADGDALVYDGGTSTWGPGAASSGTSYEAGPPTPPVSTDFTWDNQGTSTVTDGTGALILKPQGDGIIHGMVKAAPSTPYDVYCRVNVNWLSTATNTSQTNSTVGIYFKDTGGDNERLIIGIYAERVAGDENMNYALVVSRWTGASPPVFSAVPIFKYGATPWPWVRVNNDGTTLTVYVSQDGKNWFSAGTETLAAFIDGAASYGFGASGQANNSETFAVFTYFSTTAPS